jgi:alpha-acetolactate decarboxylase
MRRNKYREAIFFIFITVILVTGCSTKHIAQAPSGNLVSISNNISEIHVNGAGQGVDDRLLHDLEKYLKAKLIIAGFDIDDEKEGMTLAVGAIQ